MLRLRQIDTSTYQLISIEEWIEIVKKAKQMSTLSIFSNRTYVIFKYSLESEIIIKILARYYNTLLVNYYYPSQ